MESLSFLMFWKPTATLSSVAADVGEEDEDSFFELEIELEHQLSLPDLNTKNIKCPTPNIKEKEKQSLSPSLTNLFSKRKVMPIETQPSSRPQSPISIFKSSPRFRVSMFRKSKSMPEPKTGEKTEDTAGCLIRAKSNLSGTRTGTGRAPQHCLGFDLNSDSALLETGGGSVSKRFSKEGVQRYLKLMKQFSAKGSDQRVDAVAAAEELRIPSRNVQRRTSPLHLQSPVIPKKNVKKSRLKAMNSGAGVSSPARDDDTWQQEGIQGAILHCKESFRSSSRDGDSVSRTAAAVDTHKHKPPRREHSFPTTTVQFNSS